MTIEKILEQLGSKFCRLKYQPKAGLWLATGRGGKDENNNLLPHTRTQGLTALEALEKLLQSYD